MEQPSREHVFDPTDSHHPLDGMLGAEIRPADPIHAVVGFVEQSLLPRVFLLMCTIPSTTCWTRNSRLLLPSTPCDGALEQPPKAHFRLKTSTIHRLVGVLRAELPPLAAFGCPRRRTLLVWSSLRWDTSRWPRPPSLQPHVEGRTRGSYCLPCRTWRAWSSSVGASRINNVHHPVHSMPGAELPLSVAPQPKCRLLGAGFMGTPSAVNRDHALHGMPAAELSLPATLYAEVGLDCAPTVLAACSCGRSDPSLHKLRAHPKDLRRGDSCECRGAQNVAERRNWRATYGRQPKCGSTVFHCVGSWRQSIGNAVLYPLLYLVK